MEQAHLEQPTGIVNVAPPPVVHWRVAGTVVWSLVILGLFVFVQAVAMLVAVSWGGAAPDAADVERVVSAGAADGRLLAIATCSSTIVCGTALVLVIILKRGAKVADYLAWHWTPDRSWRTWFAGFAAFLLALDAITLLLGRPVVPEVMAQAYSSADPRWLFWIALVVAAPLFEEVFFRGFVYRGLAGSPLGPVGAIVLTAALWAGIHMQYDAYGMFSIFGMGLVLGWARWRANSVILTCLLHAFANIYATVETSFVA